MSMAMESTNFENGEYAAKLDAGPTKSKPGPILLTQDTAAEKFVSKPKGSKLIRTNTIMNTAKYKAR